MILIPGWYSVICFFFKDPATTEIYTLSLHDALPISAELSLRMCHGEPPVAVACSQKENALSFCISQLSSISRPQAGDNSASISRSQLSCLYQHNRPILSHRAPEPAFLFECT